METQTASLYKKFYVSKQIADYNFWVFTRFTSDSRIEKLAKLSPGLFSDNIHEALALKNKTESLVKWDLVFNDAKLLHISRICDALEILIKDFLVDIFKHDKNLIPKIKLTIRNPKELLDQPSKKAIENIFWENIEESIRWVDFNTLISYLKEIQKKEKFLVVDQKVFDYVMKAKKVRNLYVHSSGIVTKEFKLKSGIAKIEIGKHLKLTTNLYVELISSMTSLGSILDSATPSVRKKLFHYALTSALEELSRNTELNTEKSQ